MVEYPTKDVNPALIKYYLQSSHKILHHDERRGDKTPTRNQGQKKKQTNFDNVGINKLV